MSHATKCFARGNQSFSTFRVSQLLALLAAISCSTTATLCPSFARKEQPDAAYAARVLYDGRSSDANFDLYAQKVALSPTEGSLINGSIFPAAKRQWKDEGELNLKTLAVLSGSFTGGAAKQRLVFYKCRYDIFGLAVLEGDRLVVNYGFKDLVEPGNVKVVPALSASSRDDVAIEYWSMHQGYRHGMVSVFELGASQVKKLGLFAIAEDDLGSNKYFKFEIRTTGGATPQYYSTKYQKIRNKWTKVGSSEALKPRADNIEFFKIP
jgi:hypothetical protein